MGLCRGVQWGSGTLGWGFAVGFSGAPGPSDGDLLPGTGILRRGSAAGLSRAPGIPDGTLRWDSAGLRDLLTELCGGVQSGSGTLRPGSAAGLSRALGLSDRTLRGDSAASEMGLCCGAQPGSGTLQRGSAAGLSRAPVLASDGTLRCGSAGLWHRAPGPPAGAPLSAAGQPPLSVGAQLRCWAAGPSSDRHGSALGPGGLRRCLRPVPNGEERAAPCPPLPASPGTCPGPTSPGSEPSPASSSSRRDTAPWGRGPLPCPPLPATGAAAAGSSMELAAFYTGKTRHGPAY
ncbi:transcription initiation factor TFIID subunit 4-like [Pyrgilauda ruficollis]|uniref:transcription initiation factor TFIID subunit 4-like n=1 Tax=Pyrgilauda ruficollis TaxID=221976 RepID=UPI001B881C7B|nr:transcription initiation factor TFIID subunit 4-like [Pyrgilauda ruficollis]